MSYIKEHKKSVIFGVVCALLLAAGLKGCLSEERPTYMTMSAFKGDNVKKVYATGTVAGQTQVDVGAQVSGQILKLYVKTGQDVKAGDLLCEIDPKIQETALQTAQASVDSIDNQITAKKAELKKLMKNEREKYDAFFEQFGRQMKYAIYASYGMQKEALIDLIEFKSSAEKKYTTLAEYVARMPESQSAIYYAGGKTVDKIEMLPQTQAVTSKGIEVLYLTEDVDEFTITMLGSFEQKPFKNVSDNDLDIATEEEKEQIKQENDAQQSLLEMMKEALGDKVEQVQFTNTLDTHPVCLSTEGGISTEMQKVLEAQPGMEQAIKAKAVLEINLNHPVAAKLKALHGKDDEKVKEYAKILYAQACLICGLPIENPTELSNLVCGLM